MHSKQPGFAYSACGIFTKNKKSIQKFKETEDSRYIYQNELDKYCFEDEMDYRDFKDWSRRTASDNILRDKSFNIAKNPEYDVHQCGIASMAYKFFDKKNSGTGIKSDNISKKVLAPELRKPTFKIYEKRKVYSSFTDNIWGEDLCN